MQFSISATLIFSNSANYGFHFTVEADSINGARITAQDELATMAPDFRINSVQQLEPQALRSV